MLFFFFFFLRTRLKRLHWLSLALKVRTHRLKRKENVSRSSVRRSEQSIFIIPGRQRDASAVPVSESVVCGISQLRRRPSTPTIFGRPLTNRRRAAAAAAVLLARREPRHLRIPAARGGQRQRGHGRAKRPVFLPSPEGGNFGPSAGNSFVNPPSDALWVTKAQWKAWPRQGSPPPTPCMPRVK